MYDRGSPGLTPPFSLIESLIRLEKGKIKIKIEKKNLVKRIIKSLLSYPPYNITMQCWGPLTFWSGSTSGSADPYLWLKEPDPTPDPLPFFGDFKEAKNFFLIFSLQLTRRGIILVLKIKIA